MIVNEIFSGIDGEVNAFGQGHRSVFVRLSGCNLCCPYCDTKSAQSDYGDTYTPEQLLTAIADFGVSKLTITGGEPLLQKSELIKFIDMLSKDFKVTIETNGTIEIPEPLVRSNIFFIVDYKLFYQFDVKEFIDKFQNLRKFDFVKFCITNDREYKQAVDTYTELKAKLRCGFAFSPIFEKDSLSSIVADDFVDFIDRFSKDRIDAVLNVQLHKLLNFK